MYLITFESEKKVTWTKNEHNIDILLKQTKNYVSLIMSSCDAYVKEETFVFNKQNGIEYELKKHH